MKKRHDLDLVTKTLQSESVTLADAHDLFDEVISRFSGIADRLGIETGIGTKTVIIKNDSFESTIVETQSSNQKVLSVIEAHSVKDLLLKKSMQAVRRCESNRPKLSAKKGSEAHAIFRSQDEEQFYGLRFILGT